MDGQFVTIIDASRIQQALIWQISADSLPMPLDFGEIDDYPYPTFMNTAAGNNSPPGSRLAGLAVTVSSQRRKLRMQ